MNQGEGLIGLAARAGFVRSGEFAAEQSIKTGKAGICLLAADASEGTRKKFKDMCQYRKVPYCVSSYGKPELGKLIGREERAVLTIEDQKMAEKILTFYEGGNACGYRK